MKKISFSFQWRKFPSAVFVFWLKRYKFLFFLSFLIVTAWGSYEWYRNMVKYQWTPEAQKQYLESTIKETAFQEAGFMKVLEQLGAIADAHKQLETSSRELFVGPRPDNGTRPQ
ncbi:MAG: hypothetical protein E6P95_03270 [Candidatus Moraniibacteriota bacterium]|nr:MAG: hypothetical protein E6P95_03270 [Candidatus Moranbacteria bacterium]